MIKLVRPLVNCVGKANTTCNQNQKVRLRVWIVPQDFLMMSQDWVLHVKRALMGLKKLGKTHVSGVHLEKENLLQIKILSV